jgi:hypothetical protein
MFLHSLPTVRDGYPSLFIVDVAVVVHNDGRVDIDGDELKLTLWNHDPDRMRSAWDYWRRAVWKRDITFCVCLGCSVTYSTSLRSMTGHRACETYFGTPWAVHCGKHARTTASQRPYTASTWSRATQSGISTTPAKEWMPPLSFANLLELWISPDNLLNTQPD